MKIFFLQNHNLHVVEDGQYLVENMTVFFQAKVFVFPHNTCLPLFCHWTKTWFTFAYYTISGLREHIIYIIDRQHSI